MTECKLGGDDTRASRVLLLPNLRLDLAGPLCAQARQAYISPEVAAAPARQQPRRSNAIVRRQSLAPCRGQSEADVPGALPGPARYDIFSYQEVSMPKSKV